MFVLFLSVKLSIVIVIFLTFWALSAVYTELDQKVQNIVPVAWVFCYPLSHTKRTSILKVVQEFHVRQFSFVKSQPEKIDSYTNH